MEGSRHWRNARSQSSDDLFYPDLCLLSNCLTMAYQRLAGILDLECSLTNTKSVVDSVFVNQHHGFRAGIRYLTGRSASCCYQIVSRGILYPMVLDSLLVIRISTKQSNPRFAQSKIRA